MKDYARHSRSSRRERSTAWWARGRGSRTCGRSPGTSAAPSCAAWRSPLSRRHLSRLPTQLSSQARARSVESSPCVRLPSFRILLAKWNPTGKGRRTAPRGAVCLGTTCFLHLSWEKGPAATHTNYRRAKYYGNIHVLATLFGMRICSNVSRSCE